MTPFENTMGRKMLQQSGATITVYLSRYGVITATDADSIPMTAMIDTGASHTMVKTGIHARLGLRPHHRGQFSSASHDGMGINIFKSQLWLPTEPDKDNVMTFWGGGVAEAEDPAKGLKSVDCLIGRNLLSAYRLEYDGRAGMYRLTYVPSSEPEQLS